MSRAQRLLVAALLTLATPLFASRLPSRPSDALVSDLSGLPPSPTSNGGPMPSSEPALPCEVSSTSRPAAQ